MGSTEEQMALLSSAGVTHVSYILILYSVSFLLFLFVNILVHIYAVHAWPESAIAGGKGEDLPVVQPRGVGFYDRSGGASVDVDADRLHYDVRDGGEEVYGNGKVNGKVNGNGHVVGNGAAVNGLSVGERNRVRDAQEFELDALISEDEEEEKGGRHRL